MFFSQKTYLALGYPKYRRFRNNLELEIYKTGNLSISLIRIYDRVTFENQL